MARGVKVPIEEKIAAQEAVVEKAKAKHQSEVDKLNELLAKKDEEKFKEVSEAIKSSGKSLDEVLEFLKQ